MMLVGEDVYVFTVWPTDKHVLPSTMETGDSKSTVEITKASPASIPYVYGNV